MSISTVTTCLLLPLRLLLATAASTPLPQNWCLQKEQTSTMLAVCQSIRYVEKGEGSKTVLVRNNMLATDTTRKQFVPKLTSLPLPVRNIQTDLGHWWCVERL